MPCLRTRSCRSVHQRRTRVARALVGHLPGVVARRGVLLVRRVVLLVHHHQADVAKRCEHRTARAHHHVGLARSDSAVLRRALRRRQRRVPHGHALAQARAQTAQELRGERDLGHQHQTRLPARPCRLDGAQVHLGLARSGHAVQQQGVHAVGVDGRGDACHRSRLPLGERWRRVGLGRRAEPVEPAGIGALGRQRDLAVLCHALERGHGGAGNPHQIGRRQFAAQGHQLGQHRGTTPRGRLGPGHRARHHALTALPGGCTQRPHAVGATPQCALGTRRQHQFEARPQRAQRATAHPARQVEQVGGHHGRVHHPGNRLQATRVRGGLAAHHHTQHGAGAKAHGHKGPGHHGRIQRGGHRVIQRPVQGAGGDEGDDLCGRPPIAHISRRRPGRCRCSPR